MSVFREITWRCGRLGLRNIMRLLRVLDPRDWRHGLRLFPPDGGPSSGETQLRLRGYAGPIVLRHGTTDPDVFWQIFVEQQYEFPWAPPKRVDLVVDAGANAGYSTLFLLRHYPDARVVAVEPDPDNAALARRNVAAYGDRCAVVTAALWDEDGVAQLLRGVPGDRTEWGREVQPLAADAEDVVEALTLPSLLQRVGAPLPDVVKMDIEGAELRVLRCAANRDLLKSAEIVAIELHGEPHRAAFFELQEEAGWAVQVRGEVTFGVRRT